MTSPYSRAQRERKPLQSLPRVKELRRRLEAAGAGREVAGWAWCGVGLGHRVDSIRCGGAAE